MLYVTFKGKYRASRELGLSRWQSFCNAWGCAYIYVK